MKTIVHIITGLNKGGAEAMLFKLLQNINKEEYKCVVISMLDGGVYGESIRKLGIEVHELNIGIKNISASLVKTIQICKEADIIQCWMYHANLLGFITNLFCHKKLIWGIRRGELISGKDKTTTIFTARLSAFLSKHVTSIIYCADKSRIYHESIGYSKNRSIVIPNGFDLSVFERSEQGGEQFRLDNHIPNDCLLVAFVGRYSNVKGYHEYVRACKRVVENCKGNDIIFACAGKNVDMSNEVLTKEIADCNLDNHFLLLGQRNDIPALLSASSFFVSASFTEAFSNAIGEAMACSLPCIVTDVGDSAYIVDKTGIVVRNNSPELLSDAMIAMIDLGIEERNKLGIKARHRAEEMFEISKVVNAYTDLYDEVTR